MHREAQFRPQKRVSSSENKNVSVSCRFCKSKNITKRGLRRTKIMRQFNSLPSAKAIMKGYEIFYNFCRKHQAIGCYPYELATDLQLGKNKWFELILLSKNCDYNQQQR